MSTSEGSRNPPNKHLSVWGFAVAEAHVSGWRAMRKTLVGAFSAAKTLANEHRGKVFQVFRWNAQRQDVELVKAFQKGGGRS